MPPRSNANGISFDDALSKYLGEFGPYQRRQLLATSLFWIPNAIFILLMVFANKDPISLHYWQCVDPNDAQCKAVFETEDPGKAFCDLSRDQWEWTGDKKMSIISQFDLVCSKAILAQVSSSAFFFGYMIGSGVFGSMADAQGRRKTLLTSQAIATLGTLVSGFSPNYWVYLVSRTVVGAGSAGAALLTYLLATESIGPAWRGSAGVGTQMFFILGEFLLVLLAYLLQPWRQLCFGATALGAVTTAILLYIPESPRWLLAKGHGDEAQKIITRLADANGTRPPLEPLAGASNHAGSHNPASGPGQPPQQHLGLGDMIKDSHIARRFFVLAYVWCILCMTYYGINLALGSLKGSIYVTFAIAAAAEIPSNLAAAWLIERIGRHNTLAAGILLAGVASLICSFVPAGTPQALFAALGKFGCAGAFTIAAIYTSELFPTLIRSAILGYENQAARVGGIAAPFIVLSGTQSGNTAMPFLIFGITSLVAGMLIFTLPETLGGVMPETMKDMEAIQSIFTTKAWKKGWKATRSQLFSTRAHGSTSSLVRLSVIAEEGQAAVVTADSDNGGGGARGPSSSGGSMTGLLDKSKAVAGRSTDDITALTVEPKKQQHRSPSGNSLSGDRQASGISIHVTTNQSTSRSASTVGADSASVDGDRGGSPGPRDTIPVAKDSSTLQLADDTPSDGSSDSTGQGHSSHRRLHPAVLPSPEIESDEPGRAAAQGESSHSTRRYRI